MRACGWLTLSSLIAAEGQTAATTTQAFAASASFAYVSDDGCVQNDVIVFANRTTVDSAQAPSTTAEVTYSRYRYDYCQDSDLGTDQGTSRRPLFSGDLNRASLNATINGHTASGGSLSLAGVNQHNANRGMFDEGSSCVIHGQGIFRINFTLDVDIGLNHAAPVSSVWHP
jgi:hypothetical protein